MLPSQIKLYVEIFGALLLAALVAWFIHAQRETGRDEIRAANAQAAAAAVIHKTEVESRAKALLDADPDLARYKDSRGANPPSDALAVRVCKPARAAVASNVHTDAEPRPVADDGAGLQGAVEEGRDIGPVTEHLFLQCDAQVKALQSYVRQCAKIGACRPADR